MKQKGRKSAASLAVVQTIADTRASPPDELTDGEKSHWRRITAAKSVDYFDSGVLPLLVEYCRLKTSIDLMSAQITEFDRDWLKEDTGLARYQKLSDIRDKSQGRMISLARSMRLTNQSRYPPQTAATRSSGKSNSRLWQK